MQSRRQNFNLNVKSHFLPRGWWSITDNPFNVRHSAFIFERSWSIHSTISITQSLLFSVLTCIAPGVHTVLVLSSEWPASHPVNSVTSNAPFLNLGLLSPTIRNPSCLYPTSISLSPLASVFLPHHITTQTLPSYNDYTTPSTTPSPVVSQGPQIIHSASLVITRSSGDKRTVQCPRCDQIIGLGFTRTYYHLRTHMNSANCGINGMFKVRIIYHILTYLYKLLVQWQCYSLS